MDLVFIHLANLLSLFAAILAMRAYRHKQRSLGARFLRALPLAFGLVPGFFGPLSTSFADATSSGWDCKQDPDQDEWVCQTDQEKQTKVEKPAPIESPGSVPESQAGPPAEKTKQNRSAPKAVKEAQKPAPNPALRKDNPAIDSKPSSNAPAGTFQALEQEETHPEKPEPQAPEIAKQPGWTCKPDPGHSGWNCNLVGPDPAGRAHPVTEMEELPLASTSFDNRQELIFRDMLSKFPYDPWAQCTTQLGTRVQRISAEEREKRPVNINADYSDIYDREIITFTGNVDVTRADQRILADQVDFNNLSNTLNARGNVHYQDQDYSIYGDTAFINLDDDQGKLRNSQFIYGVAPGRGIAKLAEKESPSLSHYIDAAYTTCAPGNQDWTIETGTLKIDRDAGTGTATNAWLEVSGLPILYVPYFEFPIDDRRKSGILTPVFGLNRSTGFDFTLPYYWNIAPNVDATLIPRVMTKRGFLFGGEFRYLSKWAQGRFNGQIIPFDAEKQQARGALSFVNHTQFTNSLRSDLDINLVSDDDYLNQIGNTIALTNFSHIRSIGNLRYISRHVGALLQFENYQTIDPTIPSQLRPYRRLPQFLVTAWDNIGSTDGLLGFRGEQVYFQRDRTVTAHRTNLRPDISWPFENAWSFVTPKVALDYTQYFFQDQFTIRDKRSIPPESISRVLPLVSLDAGLFFERDLKIGGTEMIQTLEPRIYYLYVPYKNQNLIPLFDTSEFDFTLLQLFRDNRFNSVDRIGDANQLTFALTSRLLEPKSGIQRLDGTLGTITYFRDRKVQLSRFVQSDTDRTSSLVAELNGVITNEWNFRSSLQWSPGLERFTRGLALLHYQDQLNRIFNISYRFRLAQTPDNQSTITQIEQADASLRWPLFAGLTGVGRMQYSIFDKRILESFVGVEKESCCWRFRVIGRYWVQTNTGIIVGNSQPNTGIFFQLEFKGFANFGDKVDQFLERQISGYRSQQ